VNGRMSEAQCAIALMNLEDFPVNRKNNEMLRQLYETRLAPIRGLQLLKPYGVSFSNLQNVVCRVDEDMFGLPVNLLIELLQAENIDARRNFVFGLRSCTIQYTKEADEPCILLPIGAQVSLQAIERICDVLDQANRNSVEIQLQYRQSVAPR